MTPAPMMTVFGRFCVDPTLLNGAVMTDSLHRDWPGQVQWVCSQPLHRSADNPPPGSTPASRQFWTGTKGDARVFFAGPRGGPDH
jgi:hypothetical protein